MPDTVESVRIVLDAGADATPNELDTMTHGLRTELVELDLDSVASPVIEAPPGTKAGGAGVVGILVASGVISASTVKAIATVASAWLQRSGARSVILERDGDRIEVTGASRRHIDSLVDDWFDRHPSAGAD